jgi:hypothetical protein
MAETDPGKLHAAPLAETDPGRLHSITVGATENRVQLGERYAFLAALEAATHEIHGVEDAE